MTFEQTLSSFLGAERAAIDLAAYLDRFTGRYFERIDGGGDRHPVSDVFTAADITAIGTLSVSLSPEAIVELLFGRPATDAMKALSQIPIDATIYDVGAADLHKGAGLDLWQIVKGIPDLGRTKTSKLLARKRPHLLPIIDGVVAEALGNPDDYWEAMLRALGNDAVANQIDTLRSSLNVQAAISDLRIVDIVVWMANRKAAANHSVAAE